MSKKKRNFDDFTSDFLFESPMSKKSRKTEDAVLSESLGGVSRSGRVRKKSAKLMEMEDLESPELDSDGDAKGRKKNLKHTVMGEETELDPSRKVAPIKIWSRPFGVVAATPAKDGSPSTTSAVLTAIPASGYVSDSPEISTPVKSELKSPKKVKAKTSPSASKLMSPLKINVPVNEPVKLKSFPGEELESQGIREDVGLRLKLILSPKERSSASEAELSPRISIDTESDRKRKKKSKSDSGVTTLDLLASGGLLDSKPEQKTKKKVKKKISKEPIKHSVVLDDIGSPDLDYDEDDDDDDDDDEDDDDDDDDEDDDDDDDYEQSELVIAEPVPKQSKKKKPTKKSSSESKAKAKIDPEPTDFYADPSDDMDSSNSTMISTTSRNHSLYLAEKKKKSKKSNKKGKVEPKKEVKKSRPMTAYMLFCREYRHTIVAENPELDFAAISRRLGEQWQLLSDKEKLAWRRRAKKMSAKGSTIINTGKSTEQSKSKLLNKQQRVVVSDSESSPHARDLFKVVGISPIDVAAHLKLLGESLSIIGQRLTEHEGQIAVSGSLSVLLDSTLCALGPLLCLTAEVPETNGCKKDTLGSILDSIAYIMPGL